MADIIIWVLIGLVCVGLMVAGAVVLGLPGMYSLLFFIALAAVIIRYLLTSRHALAASVIGTIGASMRQNLPLSEALESASAGRTDRCSRILRRLAGHLEEGLPLSQAIRVGYPACPGHALATIAAAERIGQLPRAIASIEADLARKAAESRKVRPVHPIYPLAVIFSALMVLGGLTVFILPKYEDIFARELGTSLPKATRMLLDVFAAFGRPVWALCLVVVLVGVPIAVYAKFRPRRPDRPRALSELGDWIRWHLPVLRWFEMNSSLVRVVEVLRLSLAAGCTVDEAIDNTLRLDVNARFRRRLEQWAARVERGENVASAARQCGLGSGLAWAFDPQVNAGNTPETLESLESFYRANYDYLGNVARLVFWPCVVLGLGAMVGLIVYAMFCPLFSILEQTMETIP